MNVGVCVCGCVYIHGWMDALHIGRYSLFHLDVMSHFSPFPSPSDVQAEQCQPEQLCVDCVRLVHNDLD